MARRITFVRHGQTDKVKPDSARRLTDEGKAQAGRLREKLENSKFDIGFHSPMERTRETIVVIAGETVPTKAIPALMHDSNTDDGKLLDAAFAKLGYAPLKDYFEKSDPETRAALMRYGQTAWDALMMAAANADDNGVIDNIIVVGHAVLIPLTVYAGVNRFLNDTSLVRQVAEINLGECQGIWLEFDDDLNVVKVGTYCD